MVKEKEKKDKESSAVHDDSRPPAEEARRAAKEEKKRSEPERRMRNKVTWPENLVLYPCCLMMCHLLGDSKNKEEVPNKQTRTVSK